MIRGKVCELCVKKGISHSRLITEETTWMTLDPLTMTRTSARLYNQYDRLLCDGSGLHQQSCHCIELEWHYGKNLFKCSFLGCSFGRYGYFKKADRDSHLRHHQRPWKCGRSDCQYSDGFLSRRMRDQHQEQHQQEAIATDWSQEQLDEDELQPLLFDVVKGDRVQMAVDLLPQLPRIKEPEAIRRELLLLAASCASIAMVHLIQPKIESFYSLPTGRPYYGARPTQPLAELLVAAIEGNNVQVFKHLLLTCNGQIRYSFILPEVLKSSVEDFRMEWEACISAERNFWTQEKQKDLKKPMLGKLSFSQNFTTQHILKATAGDPGKILFLLSIWKELDFDKDMRPFHLGDALVNVAATCCSVKLAKHLVDKGAPIGHRRSDSYLTPLHHAATHNTGEAAELMKFLLISGADPAAYANSGNGVRKKRRRIEDEVGAQHISEWLGLSWEDLIKETQKERLVLEAGKAEAAE